MLGNKYKDDYKKTTYFGQDGKLKETTYYEGKYFVLPYDEKVKKKNGITCLIFAVLFLIIFFAGGMINQDSSHTFWIVFPYLFIFLPAAYNLIGAISFLNLNIKMERAQYDGSIIRMKHSARGLLILGMLNIFLDCIYIFINRNTLNFLREFIYLLFIAFLCISVFMFGRLFDKMFYDIKEESPPNIM